MLRVRLRHSASAGLALGSFVCIAVHGAGLLLVPALAPRCGGGLARRALAATEPLLLALAAAGAPAALAIGLVALLAAVLVAALTWTLAAGLASARPRGWLRPIRAACHGRFERAARTAGP